jgi:hypothetical protein
MGRSLVRATLASKSRSAMSLRVQPAARMTTAPTAKSASSHGSGAPPAASAIPHQQGSSSSQLPIGRSRRASRAKGRARGGRRRSNQPFAAGSPALAPALRGPEGALIPGLCGIM